MMGVALEGKSVLTVCGCDGEEADFLHRCGAVVTAIDLSAVAVRSARKRNASLQCACMDAESLGFADRSFDWVVVRDGLHHLARPIQGLYEMERVAREGFVVIEAQDSPPVRWLSKVGVAENWDPAGGYVYRFSRREIYKIFSSMQTVAGWKVHTAWLPFGSNVLGLFPPFRRWMYPVIKQRALYSLLNTKAARTTLKAMFETANFLIGRWGNSFIMVAWK